MTLVHGQSELPVVSERGRFPEPAALTASQNYGHDAAGRLRTWTLDGATTTYTSDAAGNLTGIDRPGTGDDTTFTPGDDNQLASAVTAGATTTYAYDDFGRRTSESSWAGETTYTWNTLGRLTGIESEDSTSTYAYGPTGMRERAVVESANTTTTTECVWSGATLVASRVSDTRETRDGVTTTVTDYRYRLPPWVSSDQGHNCRNLSFAQGKPLRASPQPLCVPQRTSSVWSLSSGSCPSRSPQARLREAAYQAGNLPSR